MTLDQIIEKRFDYKPFNYSGNPYLKPSMSIKNVSYPVEFIDELLRVVKQYNASVKDREYITLELKDIVISRHRLYGNIITFVNYELPTEGLYDTSTEIN